MRSRYMVAALVLSGVAAVCPAAFAQSGQPRGVLPPQPAAQAPRPPAPTTAAPSTAPAAPQATAPAAAPAVAPSAAKTTEAPPSEATLGAPVYPNATFMGSFDAGQGQRYFLFGTTATYPTVLQFYRATLKDKGDEVFDIPPIWTFDIGRYREQTMVYPPSVTVRDHMAGGGTGYLYAAGAPEGQRFADGHPDRSAGAGRGPPLMLAVVLAGLIAGSYPRPLGPGPPRGRRPPRRSTAVPRTGGPDSPGVSATPAASSRSGLAALLLRELLPIDALSSWSERLVGVALIAVGLWGVRRATQLEVHQHVHVHEASTHAHIHVHARENAAAAARTAARTRSSRTTTRTRPSPSASCTGSPAAPTCSACCPRSRCRPGSSRASTW